MEIKLQYIDKQLEHPVISKDDSPSNAHTHTCKQTHKHTHTPAMASARKISCFQSITSHIFIFLSPCCYNFLPCQTNQNAKTKRGLRERLRFSTVRFTDAPALTNRLCVGRRDLCVSVDLCTVAAPAWACLFVCVWDGSVFILRWVNSAVHSASAALGPKDTARLRYF